MSAPTAITIPLQNYSTGLANYDAMIVTNSAGGVVLESSSKSGGSALGAKDISFNQGYVMNTSPFTTPAATPGAGVSYSGWFWPATIQGGDMLVYVVTKTGSGSTAVITPVLQINLNTTGAPTGKAWVSANYHGTTITTSDPSSAAVPRIWNFFCFTVECSGSVAAMSLHTNGKVYTATGIAPAYVVETWSTTYLAAAGSSGSNQFVGKMDDMRSFNRVMRPMEISVLYAFYHQNMKGGTPLAASLNVLALNTAYNGDGTMAANTLTLDPQSVFSYIAVQRTPPFAQGAATQYVSAAQVQHVSGGWVWTDASYNSFAPALYSLVPYAMGVQAAKGVMCATPAYIYAVTFSGVGNTAIFNVSGSYNTFNVYNAGNLVAAGMTTYTNASLNTDISYAYTFVPVNVLGQIGRTFPPVYVPYLKNVSVTQTSSTSATFTITGYYQTVSIFNGNNQIGTVNWPASTFNDISLNLDPSYVYIFVPYISPSQPGITLFAYLPSISNVTAVPGVGVIKFTVTGNYASFNVSRDGGTTTSGSGTKYNDTSPPSNSTVYIFTPVAPDGSTGQPYRISSASTSAYTIITQSLFSAAPYYSYDGFYWFPPNNPSTNLTLMGPVLFRGYSMAACDYGSSLVNGGPGWVTIPYYEATAIACVGNAVYTSTDNIIWTSHANSPSIPTIAWTNNKFTATDGQRLVIIHSGNGAANLSNNETILKAQYYDNGNYDVSQCCKFTGTGTFYTQSIAYGNSRWVIVGTNSSTRTTGIIAYSADGATWNLSTINSGGLTIPNLYFIKYFNLLKNPNLYNSTTGANGVNGPVWIAAGNWSASMLLNILYSCDSGVSWYILTPSSSYFSGFTGANISEIDGDNTGLNFIITTGYKLPTAGLNVFNTTNGFQSINQVTNCPSTFYNQISVGLNYAGIQYADANMVAIVNNKYPVGNAKSIVLGQPVQLFSNRFDNIYFSIDTGVTWFIVPTSAGQTLSQWPNKITYTVDTMSWRISTFKYQVVYGSSMDPTPTLNAPTTIITTSAVFFTFSGLFSGVNILRTNNTVVSDPSVNTIVYTPTGNPSPSMTYTDNNLNKSTSYTYICTPLFGAKTGTSQTVTCQTPWADLVNIGPSYGQLTNQTNSLTFNGFIPAIDPSNGNSFTTNFSIVYDPVANYLWVAGGFGGYYSGVQLKKVYSNNINYYDGTQWNGVSIPNLSNYGNNGVQPYANLLSLINGSVIVSVNRVSNSYNFNNYSFPPTRPAFTGNTLAAMGTFIWYNGTLYPFAPSNVMCNSTICYDGYKYWGENNSALQYLTTGYTNINNNFPYLSSWNAYSSNSNGGYNPAQNVTGFCYSYGHDASINNFMFCWGNNNGTAITAYDNGGGHPTFNFAMYFYLNSTNYLYKIGNGFNYGVNTGCFDYYANSLYAGGLFTTDGGTTYMKGVAVSFINKAKPGQWQALGGSIGLYNQTSKGSVLNSDFYQVNSVVLNSNTGVLYVGGQFTVACNLVGGNPTYVTTLNIAQYDPSYQLWSPVGTGLTNTSIISYVSQLYFDPINNDLYAAGNFTMDGVGNPMYNVAKINMSSIVPNIKFNSITPVSNSVTSDVITGTVMQGGKYGGTVFSVYSFQPIYLAAGTSATYTITYTCTSARTIYIFAVGGGGGGGTCVGGGGGGGAVVMSSVILPSTGSGGNTIAVTVGGGGAGGSGPITTAITSYSASYGGGQGMSSSVTFNDPTLSGSSITAAGGGGGGANANGNGGAGSSGGGAAGFPLNLAASAGAGTSNQGYNGGTAAKSGSAPFTDGALYATGGGGGGAGSAASGPTGGNGVQINATTSPIIADFHPNSIPYSTYYWGGGGGGGGSKNGGSLPNGNLKGGKGGGGGGSYDYNGGFNATGDTNTSLANGGNGKTNGAQANQYATNINAYSGLGGNGGPNTGGGGGGAYNGIPGNGGSGIVIIAFPQT